MISDNVEFFPPIFYAVFWQPFWKWKTSRKFWKRRIAPLMVTYHYVKFYVSIIIHLEVININVRNFNFPIGFYCNPHPHLNPPKYDVDLLYHKAENFRTRPSFMKFCPVVPEICRGQVHGPRKERRKRIIIIIKIIIIRNGAKTISLPNFAWKT